MQNQLKTIYHKIANDDIANTMKENALSQEFLMDRVNEIIEEQLINEKEMQIEKYIQEIAYLKSEMANA
jgi:transcriptional regulator CtsR